MNKKIIIVNNIVIRLIIVEPRILIDLFKFINIRTKIYNGVLNILLYVGEKNILFVCKL